MSDWARLKELYQMAEERPAAESAVFLESACAGDEELLREVQSLLAAGAEADSFLESAPNMVWAARAAAMAGTTLGHYRLESLLGRGGMGLVYRTTDMRLGRTVAVKIVRPEMAATADRDGFRCIWFARFEDGRPSAPIPLHHFHAMRQSLNNVPVSALQMAVSRDRMVFDLNELSGNIWLAR